MAVFDATATLTDVVLDEVRNPTCAASNPPCPTALSGLASVGGNASVTLERAQIRQAPQCGVYAAQGGQIAGTDVLLAGNGIGARFDDPNYDAGRVGAEYLGNGANIAVSDLPPVPE